MANVLVVDDEANLRNALGELLKMWGHQVQLAANYAESLTHLDDGSIDVILTDVMLPDGSGIDLVKTAKERNLTVPIVILTGHGSIEDAVTAIHLGAENYLTKPVEPPRLKLVIDQIVEKGEMQQEVKSLRQQLRKAGTLGAMKGRSEPMQKLYTLIERVSPTEASVFITGESGTGKTLIAKTIHDYSRRRNKPFVAVNCAAIAPTLIESELFGHEKGAFTGATQQRRGYFEEAFGGTIFLDEITELPIELQGKLLRVLEENRIRRVGGNTELQINVRIISASNRDPKKAIEDGKLREDLYYRINIFPIHACSLRERPEDIPFLATMFLEKLCEEENRNQMTIEAKVLELLKAYQWPGNVRELRNVMNRALIVARGDRLTLDALPDYLKKEVNMAAVAAGNAPAVSLTEDRAELSVDEADERDEELALVGAEGGKSGFSPKSDSSSSADPFAFLGGEDATLETMERLMIQRLLADTDSNKPLVAEKLGISLKTLYNKIKKYDL